MHYYLVHVAEMRYQKAEPLTYASDTLLPPGALVTVPYGNKKVIGFIRALTTEPSFKTKQVAEHLPLGSLPKSTQELHAWMQHYYPGAGGATTLLFVSNDLSKTQRPKLQKNVPQVELPELRKDQAKVLGAIAASDKKSILLHGETGSGKTRIYIERAKQSLKNNRSVLILTPEISLVPQLVQNISEAIDDEVIPLHSGLTKSTRASNWKKIHDSQEPLVVIGTRSALFAPLKNLGLVVVDEMHEPAYKQESQPRYHALRVAAQLARIHSAEILYGSATPPVVEYYVAEKTGTPILRMHQPAQKTSDVIRTIIDMKDSGLFSRNRSLSDPLLSAIEKRLVSKEQVLLFLNRRGTARTVLCQSCGWQAMCPRCDTPLTYHGDSHTLRCHTCGFQNTPPFGCPSCGSDNIVYRSVGTKALVESLYSLFPQARIQRFDTDNTAEEQLHRQYESVKSGDIDILVGTQLLGKGLDLPKLALVGIVNADTALALPDFSASERSYQLLHQAIGRVGRGHRNGEVIVQSFNPENPLLQAALEQRWQDLYEHEIAERRTFLFPPYCFLLKIVVSRKSSQSAEAYTNKLRDTLQSMQFQVRISDPTPGFYEKSFGKYNWQLVIRSKRRSELTNIVTTLPAGDFTFDLDPIHLL